MSDSKKEIIKEMTDLEFYPQIDITENKNLSNYEKLPITEILSLGPFFEPVANAIQGIFQGGATETLYRVSLPKAGTHLAQFKNSSAFLGTTLNSSNKIVGQARLNPVKNATNTALMCNPYMMFMAAALITVSRKLDIISETQKELLELFEQKERANLLGDLNFLSDIINNYKFNWNNENYINNNHIKVLDIKQQAERSIFLLKNKPENIFAENDFIHMNWDVDKKKSKLLTTLGDYQIAVYLYSFSSYVEVLLLENFEAGYINKIIEKINKYALEYREIFSSCSEQIEKYSNDSFQSTTMRGFAGVTKFLGGVAGNIPFLDRNIHKGINETGEKIEINDKQRNKDLAKEISIRKSVDVIPFVENLSIIEKIYNQSSEFLIDKDYIYLDN